MSKAADDLTDFKRAGFDPMPLSCKGDEKSKGKKPAHIGWETKDYSSFDFTGFNIGFRLKPDQLVIDVDPRNGGDDSLERLCAAVGCDLRDAPTTITGGGGWHHYYTKPSDLVISLKIAEYPGIEFKSHIGLVVAPGSMHFKSGKRYRIDRLRPPISQIAEAPAKLLELLAKPVRAERTSDGGEIDNEQLARLLACIDVEKYGRGRYDEWITLSAACHDATAGWGEEAWRDWCMSDYDYSHEEAVKFGERLWDSFEGGMAGGATIGTLFRAAQLGGGSDVVKQIQYEIRRDKALKEFMDDDDEE